MPDGRKGLERGDGVGLRSLGWDAAQNARGPFRRRRWGWTGAEGTACGHGADGLQGTVPPRPPPPTVPHRPRAGSYLPRIHFSDRCMLVPFFPWQGPMKMAARRGTPVTRPPHRWTSSRSLALGGALAGEMNIGGCPAKRVPRYGPADKWRSRRQSCGQRRGVRP